jgi:hypothetical protein
MLLFGSACAAEPIAINPDPVPATPPAALQQIQTGRILDDLAGQLRDSAADSSTETATRLDGAALIMRQSEFELAAALPDQSPSVLGTEFVGTAVQATDQWPRSFIATTEPIDSFAPYLYLLTQTDPWTPYRLVEWVNLLPGTTLPETADPRIGSRALPFDSDELLLSPQAALEAYCAVKADPNAPEAQYFAGEADPARAYWAALLTAFEPLSAFESSQVVQSHRAAEGVGLALETAVGGAIVVGQLTSGLALTFRQAAGEQGGQVRLPADWVALAGRGPAALSAASISYSQTVALWVPPAGSSDKIQVLGFAQVPTEASIS